MMIDWQKIEIENQSLSVQSSTFIGEGWISRAYLVNSELVFKFPKRSTFWKGLEREIAFLSFASSHLPLAVPRYVKAAPNSLAAPCGYAVYEYIAGRAIDISTMTQERRTAAVDAIAAFLRALHQLQPSLDVASMLPKDDARITSEEYFARAECEIVPKLLPREALALRKEFESYLNIPENFSFRPAMLHADFSREHILVEGESIVGVIDFGDVSWGDPDYDFMYLFLDFGQAFTEELAQRYGHTNIELLMAKVRYFSIVDQIGTILDGVGLALEGQEEAAWSRLRRLLQC